jgi:phage baseplate assembly protein W
MEPDLIGSGWAFPLGVTRTGGIAMSSGAANVERAMRIILATYPGERPMRPNFGSRLRDYQFEAVNPDNAAAIEAEVVDSLTRCEPRVQVIGVDVVPMIAEVGAFHLDIKYLISDELHERNLVVPFYAIPEE